MFLFCFRNLWPLWFFILGKVVCFPHFSRIHQYLSFGDYWFFRLFYFLLNSYSHLVTLRWWCFYCLRVRWNSVNKRLFAGLFLEEKMPFWVSWQIIRACLGLWFPHLWCSTIWPELESFLIQKLILNVHKFVLCIILARLSLFWITTSKPNVWKSLSVAFSWSSSGFFLIHMGLLESLFRMIKCYWSNQICFWSYMDISHITFQRELCLKTKYQFLMYTYDLLRLQAPYIWGNQAWSLPTSHQTPNLCRNRNQRFWFFHYWKECFLAWDLYAWY